MIRIKIVGKTENITRKTHHRATIMIRPTIVITVSKDVRGKAIGKQSDKAMRTFNGRCVDDSI